MCLGLVQVILVVCWVITTGLVDPYVLCSSPFGNQHCRLSSGKDGVCLGLSVMVRMGVIKNSVYWTFHEYLYFICVR